MKPGLLLIGLVLSAQLFGQFDTSFFPNFKAHDTLPILDACDLSLKAPWNDPSVIKEGPNNYVMYASGTETGLAFVDTIKVFRFESNNGYDWTLNPSKGVVLPEPGTYNQSGVETPSVVKLNNTYHMYFTTYAVEVLDSFKIGHATSVDGINWTKDDKPFLQGDPGTAWMSKFTSEPGVMERNDTLYIFYTTMDANFVQTIGLVRSTDGSTIIDTMYIVDIPTDVYNPADGYLGLSTPSPCMVGDTIYLFTDVTQMVLGNFSQTALHQFKSYGNLNKWYHDDQPIHTWDDFSWTDGNYESNLIAPTAIMDGNKLRLWYAGFNLSDIDTTTWDTTSYGQFIGSHVYPLPGHWGIGTSEYNFKTVTTAPNTKNTSQVSLSFDGKYGEIINDNNELMQLYIYTIDGKLLSKKSFYHQTVFNTNDYSGILLLKIISSNKEIIRKVYSTSTR